MGERLLGKRVLLTQADAYMGPAIERLFRAEGAAVVSDASQLQAKGAVERVVSEAGPIDVLVANLAHAPVPASVAEIQDEHWHALFEALVHPLMRLVRAT